MHARTHALTHARTHARTHGRTHAHTHTHARTHARAYDDVGACVRVYYFNQLLRKTKHSNLALVLYYSSDHARRCNHRPTRRRRRHRPVNKPRTSSRLRPLSPATRSTTSVPGHPNRVRLRRQRQAHRHCHQTHRQTRTGRGRHRLF